MDRLPSLLNVLAAVLWLGVTYDLVRRPPRWPALWSAWARRTAWLVVSLLALVSSAWSPRLWDSTTTLAGRDPQAGAPWESVGSSLRTPFATFARRATLDAEGRTIENRRTVTLQLPLVLLAFLGGALWLRRGSLAGSSGAGRGAVTGGLALVLVAGASACGADGGEGGRAGRAAPDRTFVDATWDTLAHIRSDQNDSLLFAAGRPIADERGFWVADTYGMRIAQFDWEGHLLGYAGRQGGGPGELGSARYLDLDGQGNLWVLDVANSRLTAFDAERRLSDEVSLRGVDSHPDAFAVSSDGQGFHLMLAAEQLQPTLVHRDGRVTRGTPIEVPEANGAWGMALQGVIAREHGGDRWIHAFSSGNGFVRVRGTELAGPISPYQEPVPFPVIVRSVERDGSATSTTTRVTERIPAAAAVWAGDGELYVLFRGTTDDAGRLLDRYDLETGRYLDTVLLPQSGYVTMWEDRLVISGNNPGPEVLVLRRRP